MQFSESFYGSIPRVDPSKGYDKPVRGTPARIAGVNYTSDENLWGYFPLLICWPGKVLHASTGDYTIRAGLAQKIVDSFKKGDDTGEKTEPLGIDTEHAIYRGEGNTSYNGYIVDELVTSAVIETYTAGGVKVVKDEAEGTETVMGKIAWLDDGYKLIESGTMPYMSIVFNDDNGNVTQGKPTITSNPADTELPAMVVCSKKVRCQLDTNVAKINELVLTLTEEQQNALIAQLEEMIKSGGNPPAETPPAEPAANKAFEAFAKEITDKLEDFKKILSSKQVPATDEGVIAAKEELIKAGYLPNVASEHANQFSGIKPENAVLCAKAWLTTNKAPQLGSQLFTAKEDYPEDIAEHARQIRASAKKEGRTMLIKESLDKAKELRGDK
jgi:phage I-like protein